MSSAPDETKPSRSPGWLLGIAGATRLQLITHLSDADVLTIGQLAERCHLSRATVERHLSALVALGAIEARPGESDGESKGRPAARFRLDPGLRRKFRLAVEHGTG
jgi:predicted ArsR family transcriptional regulator